MAAAGSGTAPQVTAPVTPEAADAGASDQAGENPAQNGLASVAASAPLAVSAPTLIPIAPSAPQGMAAGPGTALQMTAPITPEAADAGASNQAGENPARKDLISSTTATLPPASAAIVAATAPLVPLGVAAPLSSLPKLAGAEPAGAGLPDATAGKDPNPTRTLAFAAQLTEVPTSSEAGSAPPITAASQLAADRPTAGDGPAAGEKPGTVPMPPAAVPNIQAEANADLSQKSSDDKGKTDTPEDARQGLPQATLLSTGGLQPGGTQSLASGGLLAPKQPASPAQAIEIDPARPEQKPGPLREISLTLPNTAADSGQKAGDIEVRVLQSAGQVQVTVKTADEQLTQNLRQQLGDLVTRLEHSGYQTETWHPAATAPALGAASAGAESAWQEFRGGAEHGSSNSSGGGDSPPGHGNSQRRNQQQAPPQWLETLEGSFQDNEQSTRSILHGIEY